MELGSISLRAMGQLQQLLGLVSAQPLLSQSQLVATGAGCFRLGRLFLGRKPLLVSAVLQPARSAFTLLPQHRSSDSVAAKRTPKSAAHQSSLSACSHFFARKGSGW